MGFNTGAVPPNNGPLPNCKFHRYMDAGFTDLRCLGGIEGFFVKIDGTSTTPLPDAGVFPGCSLTNVAQTKCDYCMVLSGYYSIDVDTGNPDSQICEKWNQCKEENCLACETNGFECKICY